MDDCPDPGILVASDGIRSGSACYAPSYTRSDMLATLEFASNREFNRLLQRASG
jgi:hypothetical protein